MIEKLIKERMQVIGLTQARLAELVGCTPTQLGLFLKSEASLNRESLDKCLKVVGINLDVNLKRIETARLAASRLVDFPLSEIKNMGRHTMSKITQIDALDCLPDPNESDFEKMVSSGIIDYEATYPFFKSLVLHFRNLGDNNLTPKTVQTSLETIAKALPLGIKGTAVAGAVLFSGALLPVSLIGVAIGSLMNSKIYSKVATNAWAPLLTITKELLKK